MSTTRVIGVTAATGRLGRAILRALLDETAPGNIVAMARDPARVEPSAIDRRKADYQDRDACTVAFEGVDTLVMISAPVVVGTDRVGLHRNVIEAARRAGVRRVIYTSVIGSGGEEGTGFAEAQAVNRQTEADLEASGLVWTVARNGLYLDLDLIHIIAANEAGVYHNNGGNGSCGYISISELGIATAKLALSDGFNNRIVNLTSENVTQADLVADANRVFGLQVRYEPISAGQNVARFMKDPKISARGEEVARMLTGCFECIERGAFDVPSDFEAVAGRPPKPLLVQMEELRDSGKPEYRRPA